MEQYENEITNLICNNKIDISDDEGLKLAILHGGFLYLGRQQAVGPKLQEKGITAVLTIMDIKTYQKQKLKEKISELGLLESHLHFDAFDSRYTSIKGFFEPAYHFFQKHLNQGRNVLIHCKRGVSRSPAILASYLMKKYDLDFDQCNKLLKQRRPVVRINKGFENQLKQYSGSLKKEAAS